jgi:hypothetical protein
MRTGLYLFWRYKSRCLVLFNKQCALNISEHYLVPLIEIPRLKFIYLLVKIWLTIYNKGYVNYVNELFIFVKINNKKGQRRID